jgi:DNA-binding GntR family transcriptional regulator
MAHELAPIRDAYRGGPEQDDVTLDIHRRQLQAMRARDLGQIDQLLDEHFRQLEDAFAEAVGSDWERLFGPTVGKLIHGVKRQGRRRAAARRG